jgi:hypothetical protein
MVCVFSGSVEEEFCEGNDEGIMGDEENKEGIIKGEDDEDENKEM